MKLKIKREAKSPKTVEEHLNDIPDDLKKLFWDINNKILDISSEIERYTTNSEVIYKTSFNIAYLSIQKQKKCLRYLLRTENDYLKDPKHLTKKIPKTHGYGKISRILYVYPSKIDKDYSIEDILDLISQSYNTTQ